MTGQPRPPAGAESESGDGPAAAAEPESPDLLRLIEAKARELEEAVIGAGAQARKGAGLAALGAAASAGLAVFWSRRRKRGATRIEIHRL